MPAQRSNRPKQQPQKLDKSELAIMKKNVIDVTAGRIEKFIEGGDLHLPKGYSAQNALKSAWLVLQAATDKDGNSVLKVCTQDSIANSLLSMIVQGLNPDKKQCYFIAYGRSLTCQRSYFGAVAIAKRMSGVRDVWAEVVYEGDKFEYEINHGIKTVVMHRQALAHVDPTKIVAAYAVITFRDPEQPDYCEIMTWEQIQKAWSKSRANTNRADGPHQEFPDQMAMRTVINRGTKRYINSSSDDHLLLQHFNSEGDVAEAEMDEAIESVDQEVIDVEGGPIDEAEDAEDADVSASEQPPEGAQPQPSNEPPAGDAPAEAAKAAAAAGLDF